MSVTRESLLELGYFPKELPPPFHTSSFVKNLKTIDKEWNKVLSLIGKLSKPKKDAFKDRFRESKWVSHSIPKVGFSRRLLGIPNPYHQAILCKSIVLNWSDMEKVFIASSISSSKPTLDKSNKRAFVPQHDFERFKRERLIASFDKPFEVRTDISRYYPTIYTHVIPWVVHGKIVAKKNRNDLTLYGNLLDKNLRDGNSGQTLGIPIGPDTSLIVSEIIGCGLDLLLSKKFKSIKAFRYFDDYYVYCETQELSERVFKFLHGLLTEYQLDINEEKTRIVKSPFPFDSVWAMQLGSFEFRASSAKAQQTDLERFLSLAFKHAEENRKEAVLKYAIQCLKTVPLFKESWSLYESVVLKIALIEPGTLDDLATILVSHRSKVSVNRVKSVVESIIKEHCPKGHDFEVAWALWICKELKIKLPDQISRLVLASRDPISILIALDLKSSGLINSHVSTKEIEMDLTTDSLMEENWLLTYEAIIKAWVKIPTPNPIGQNEYFQILSNGNVSFYDHTKTLEPLKVKALGAATGTNAPTSKQLSKQSKGPQPKIPKYTASSARKSSY